MVATVCAAMLMLVSGHAYAALYWTNGSELARANMNGSEFDLEFIAEDPDPIGTPVTYAGCESVAVGPSHIYWSEPARGSIARANLDGSGIEYHFLSGLEHPCGIAVDGTSIYWTEEEMGTIAKANLDGNEADRTFISGLVKPCGVAVGDGYLYWAGGHYLARAPLTGGVPQQIYKEGENAFDLCGVALDAAHVYWGGFGESIGRAGLDGSNPEPSFITGIDRPCGIAVQGGRIYWTRNEPVGSVQSTDLEGNHVVETVVDQGGYPCGMAADTTMLSRPLYPPFVPHEISFGRSRHGIHSPVTFIRIKFPQAGTFKVRSGPSVRWRVLPHASATFTLPKPEERVLKVWPAAGNQRAKKLGAILRRIGKAQVSISVRFSAEDGVTSTKQDLLFLIDRRHGRKHHTSRSPGA